MKRDNSDIPRDVLKERQRRTEPNYDETDSAFESEPLTVSRNFSIIKQRNDRLRNAYNEEIKRRNTNEMKRQESYNERSKSKMFF